MIAHWPTGKTKGDCMIAFMINQYWGAERLHAQLLEGETVWITDLNAKNVEALCTKPVLVSAVVKSISPTDAPIERACGLG